MSRGLEKLYQALTYRIADASLKFNEVKHNSYFFQSIKYAQYLIESRGPRFSYSKQFTDEYTPWRVQYALPISAVVSGSILFLSIYSTKRQQRKIKSEFELLAQEE
ncbi:hypothetical protein pb186bvf_010799 [Paramecium bursaria]